MLQGIKLELRTAQSFTFSVAFISSRGIALLKQALLDFKGKGRIITSRYLDFNDPTMFRELLTLENVEVLIHQGDGFHSKGYVFHHDVGITAVVGSSNLTDNALLVNREWNLKFSASKNGDIAFQLDDAINRQTKRSTPLTPEWITEYEATRRVPERLVSQNIPLEDQSDAGTIVPNLMQEEALDALHYLTEKGEKRGVIISATGTGKTILAALAARMLKPERVLFVVHREQILDKARSEFIKVLERLAADFGKMSGSTKELDKPFVFGTIQTLTKEATLSRISPTDFDLVIVDEVHRAGAESYLALLNHLQPQFLLGLTATPERTDGFNIYELFDFNVPYEIRLQAALESNMLVPFHYYGVTDFTLDSETTVTDTSKLSALVSEERVHHILEALKTYGHPENVRGLIFCSKTEEAEELSKLLNQSLFNGSLLKTKALSAKASIRYREQVVAELESGDLDYILTVDIFNEGIDIPSVNQIVMIRSTANIPPRVATDSNNRTNIRTVSLGWREYSIRSSQSPTVGGGSLTSKHPGFTSVPPAPKCRPPRITFKASNNINPDTDPFGIARPLRSPSTTRRQETSYPTTSSIFTPRERPCSTAQARSFLSKSVVRYSGMMNGPSM